jgi:hypothetical protein
VVLKLKNGIPDEQIDAAVFAIKRICEKLFGNPDVDEKGAYNLTVLFKQLASSKLKNLKAEAVSALIPIIDSIDTLADLVVKVSDEDQFSQQRMQQTVPLLLSVLHLTGISNYQNFHLPFSNEIYI